MTEVPRLGGLKVMIGNMSGEVDHGEQCDLYVCWLRRSCVSSIYQTQSSLYGSFQLRF